MSGSLSVLFFLVYWIFLIGGEDLADRGFLSPVVAMWTPNLVMLLVGLWLMRSAVREGTPVRLPAWLGRFRRAESRDESTDAERRKMAELARELEQPGGEGRP